MSDDKIKTPLEGMRAMLELAKKRTSLSEKRTELAEERTKLAAERTYMNYERTLSVWVRTSLAVMVFGIAIDRLWLMFYEAPAGKIGGNLLQTHFPSTLTGAILIFLSILIALFSGLRFIFLTRRYWNENYSFMSVHKTWLPAVYAFMVVLFGAGLLVLMLWIF